MRKYRESYYYDLNPTHEAMDLSTMWDMSAKTIAFCGTIVILSWLLRLPVTIYRWGTVLLFVWILCVYPFTVFVLACGIAWTAIASVSVSRESSLSEAVDTILSVAFGCQPTKRTEFAESTISSESPSKSSTSHDEGGGVLRSFVIGLGRKIFNTIANSVLRGLSHTLEGVGFKKGTLVPFIRSWSLNDDSTPKDVLEEKELTISTRGVGYSLDACLQTLDAQNNERGVHIGVVICSGKAEPVLFSSIEEALGSRRNVVDGEASEDNSRDSEYYEWFTVPLQVETLQHLIITGSTFTSNYSAILSLNPILNGKYKQSNAELIFLVSISSPSVKVQAIPSNIAKSLQRSGSLKWSSNAAKLLNHAPALGLKSDGDGQSNTIRGTPYSEETNAVEYYTIPQSTLDMALSTLSKNAPSDHSTPTDQALLVPDLARAILSMSIVSSGDVPAVNALVILSKAFKNLNSTCGSKLQKLFIPPLPLSCLTTLSKDRKQQSNAQSPLPLAHGAEVSLGNYEHCLWHCCLALNEISMSSSIFTDAKLSQFALAILERIVESSYRRPFGFSSLNTLPVHDGALELKVNSGFRLDDGLIPFDPPSVESSSSSNSTISEGGSSQHSEASSNSLEHKEETGLGQSAIWKAYSASASQQCGICTLLSLYTTDNSRFPNSEMLSKALPIVAHHYRNSPILLILASLGRLVKYPPASGVLKSAQALSIFVKVAACLQGAHQNEAHGLVINLIIQSVMSSETLKEFDDSLLSSLVQTLILELGTVGDKDSKAVTRLQEISRALNHVNMTINQRLNGRGSSASSVLSSNNGNVGSLELNAPSASHRTPQQRVITTEDSLGSNTTPLTSLRSNTTTVSNPNLSTSRSAPAATAESESSTQSSSPSDSEAESASSKPGPPSSRIVTTAAAVTRRSTRTRAARAD